MNFLLKSSFSLGVAINGFLLLYWLSMKRNICCNTYSVFVMIKYIRSFFNLFMLIQRFYGRMVTKS